ASRRGDAAMRRSAALALCLAFAACGGSPDTQSAGAPPAALAEPEPIEAGRAPPPGEPYAPGFDAVHYDIALALPDTGTYIRGVVAARIALVEPPADTLALDLPGLAVERVRVDGSDVPHRHAAGRLHVPVPA